MLRDGLSPPNLGMLCCIQLVRLDFLLLLLIPTLRYKCMTLLYPLQVHKNFWWPGIRGRRTQDGHRRQGRAVSPEWHRSHAWFHRYGFDPGQGAWCPEDQHSTPSAAKEAMQCSCKIYDITLKVGRGLVPRGTIDKRASWRRGFRIRQLLNWVVVVVFSEVDHPTDLDFHPLEKRPDEWMGIIFKM